MNKARLRLLANHLEKIKAKQFNLDWYACTAKASWDIQPVPAVTLHRCGSAGCIAGWAVALFGTESQQNADNSHIHNMGAQLLGLTGEQASNLFLGCWSEKSRAEVTQQEAADQLRKLADS